MLVKRELGTNFSSRFPDHAEDLEIPNAADLFPNPKLYEESASVVSSSVVAQPPAQSSSAPPLEDSAGVTLDGIIVTPIRKRRSLENVEAPARLRFGGSRFSHVGGVYGLQP